MAATAAKAPYDPTKTLEGMFNGSVTRIAYVLKDPGNFGPQTKVILAECAKKFQDALDDCEIQLLDAKWYLEHQLAQNKARREAKEKESNTAAAKRKHEELLEQAQREEAESAAKRPKTEQENTAKSDSTPQAKTAVEPEPMQVEDSKPTKPSKETDKPDKDEVTKTDGEKPATEKAPVEPEKPPEAPQDSQISLNDFSKPTPNDTPVNGNEDFNFESMFGEPPGDGNDPLNDDMDLDFGLGDAFSKPNQDPSSLLSGFDSFTDPAGNTSGPAAGDSLPNFTNEFDLPDLGDSTTFDDFLNDDSFGAGNFDGGIDLKDDALKNMSFDDMFNDDI